MEDVLGFLLVLAATSICFADVKSKNQTQNTVRSTVKVGNHKRWMPALSQYISRDVDNNMGFYDGGFGGNQVSQTQEPIGSITANYNNQDQLGGVPQEPMAYNDPGAAMSNEIGLPETMGDSTGVQQDIGREGFQQNIGNEVSAFMKQEPNALDSPENFAQLEGLGESFSSKLSESDLLGTNLQTINSALLPKANAFIGAKNTGLTASNTKLPSISSLLSSTGSANALPAQSSAGSKEPSTGSGAPVTTPVAKPVPASAPISASSAPETPKVEPSPAPVKPVSPPSATNSKVEQNVTKEVPAAPESPAADIKAPSKEPEKPKNEEETKKVESKKEEAKQEPSDPAHTTKEAEAPAKDAGASKSDNAEEASARHLKTEAHAKKKHKGLTTGSRRHSTTKAADQEESGDGEDEEEDTEGNDSTEKVSSSKEGKVSSDANDTGGKQEQDQRIQKLKERIRVQKIHKHKYKASTGTERQLITAKLGGVEDSESEQRATEEENHQLDALNLNSNVVSPNQLAAIESQLRAQGTNPGLPSASIKQQLVSSLKQALLANVAAMIKNKAKSIGNPVESPLQNIANQFFAKAPKQSDSEDEDDNNESSEQNDQGKKQGDAQQQQQQQVQQSQEANHQGGGDNNDDQKGNSAPSSNDPIEQDLMKVDKKKLVHVLASLMKSQKGQGTNQLMQLLGSPTNNPGGNAQNFMKQKSDNAQDQSQTSSQAQDDQGDNGDDQGDDDDSQDDTQAQDGQHQQQQESENEKARPSKQGGRAGQQQQLTPQQQQALIQQLKIEQQEQTGRGQDDKEQKESENGQETAPDGKSGARITDNQRAGAGEENRGDQGDQAQDDDQGDQGQDDSKGSQGSDSQESGQSQQSQSKLANELLQRIHNKEADMNKEKEGSSKENAGYGDEGDDDKDKERASQRPSEESGKKLKHGAKSRHLTQKPLSDPYSQIGLEDPSNNDKLPHKSKAEPEDKDTDVDNDGSAQDNVNKEQVGAKAQGSSMQGKLRLNLAEQSDDSDVNNNAQSMQAPKGAAESPRVGQAISQFQQQALQMPQQQQQQQQQQQLLTPQADLQQLNLSHGGRHHASRHILNVQKFIGSQGGSLTSHLLSKSRTGLSRGDMKTQVEDIYATIGSFDPNVRKKKHKIYKAQ